MAKSLDQLQKELGVASEKARKAYDILNGTGGRGGLERNYQLAVKNKDKEALATLKPLYEKTLAEYKTAQEAKNAANLALKKAKVEDTKAKETAAKSKSAQSVYDKAIQGLKDAELKFAGYKGQEGYIAAYQKAQAAYDNAVALGVTPKTPLPAQKIEVPVIEQKGTTAATGAETPVEKSLTEVIDFLSTKGNESILKKVQTDLSKNFGYKGNTDGKWSVAFSKALSDAATTRASVPSTYRSTGILDFIAAPPIDVKGTSGTGTGTANVPPITDYPVVSSATDAQKLINDVFQSNLNRDATAAEVKLLYPLLKKAQLDNPTSYKETTLNGKKARVQYSGLDSAQWLLDQIKSNAALNLKSELDTAKTEAPDLAKRLSDKKIYDKMIADAGNDFTKIQAAKETTAYGRGLAELEATIQAKALESGASNDPAEITALAKSLYDKGINPNSSVGMSQIESALKYAADVTTGKFKGTAATTVADLQTTAAANGLDLQKNFGDKIAGWISAINSGEQVDNIKQQIRDVAKLGQPDSVKKLIDNGIDLSTIYSPYKNAMASTLEINPQTIGMDDPTLRSAITPTGEMNLYDYSKMLRKDTRWQYTKQANGEVADATKKILQDFGFMG